MRKRESAQISSRTRANDDSGSQCHDAPKDASQADGGTKERYSSAHMKPAPGSSKCKCGQCGEVFSGLTPFDMHQRITKGVLVCTYPLDVVNSNGDPTPMEINSSGVWVTRLMSVGDRKILRKDSGR